MKFEESLKELEKIITDLEKGELPLEQALEMYAKGVTLLANCEQTLKSAEQKIELLLSEGRKEFTLVETK
ncbi:MAG: exodeoxyribonuclease VII small subunit [bacterium]|nr:exodeoxyribonuclease VII small subunit [bacterium]